MIMPNDDFFDVKITLDSDTLNCVFNKNQLPSEALDALPLFTTDELTDDIRYFEATDSSDRQQQYTRSKTTTESAQQPTKPLQ